MVVHARRCVDRGADRRGSGTGERPRGCSCSIRARRDIPRSRPGSRRSPISPAGAGSRSPRPTRAADFSGSELSRYRTVVFLNNAGDRLNGEQEGALADFMQGGGGFVGIGTAAESEPGSRAARRPDRGAAGPGERDRGDDSDARGRRPRAPVDARPAARAQPHRRLVPVADAADRQRPHRRALAGARRPGGRRHVDRRDRPSDLVVPRHPRRALVLHRHGPHRGRLRRAQLPHPPAGRDPVGDRTRARQLQGDDQRQLPRHARGERRTASRPASPPAASRTASRSRPTAG